MLNVIYNSDRNYEDETRDDLEDDDVEFDPMDSDGEWVDMEEI